MFRCDLPGHTTVFTDTMEEMNILLNGLLEEGRIKTIPIVTEVSSNQFGET